MAAMYDNLINPVNAAMINGAIQGGSQTLANMAQQYNKQKELENMQTAAQVAQEMAGNQPVQPTLNQMASQVPQEQAQPYYNQDLANQVLANVMQQNMANAQPAQPVQQPQEESPALTTGLLLSDGVRAALADYDNRELAAAQNAQPTTPATLTQMARELAGQIVEAKNIYDQGAAIGGEQGMKAMMNAHTAAERARNGLLQLGVDPSVYGLDSDYNTARQAVADNDTRALKNVLEGEMAESSGEYYDRIYMMLRNQGFASDVAEREAQRRAASYASKRVRSLNDAFNTYGHNNTTINPLGIQILNMMADEDTEKAGSYLKQYARPLDEYAYAKQRGLAEQQQGFAEKNMATKHQYGLEDMTAKTQLTAQLKQLDAQIQDARDQRNFAREKSLLAYKAQIQMALGGGKSSAGSKGGQQNGGMKVSEAIQITKQYNDWNKEHEGEEWQNPYKDANDQALAVLNNQKSAPDDVDNAQSVYSWAQSVLEENARRGYPATADALYQVIASVGGYGQQVADDFRKDGKLNEYGRN